MFLINKRKCILLIIIIIFSTFYFYSKENVVDRGSDNTLKKLINLFKDYNRIIDDKPLNQKELDENHRTRREIEKIFDYETLINGILLDQLIHLKKNQVNEFHNKFKQLVEKIAYSNASYFYHNSNNKIKKAVFENGTAKIQSNNHNIDKDIEIDITYIFEKKNNNWMMTDIFLSNRSLVEAYRMQINRIVNKKGIDGLLNVINEKHKELNK